jgi:hypothetical protein
MARMVAVFELPGHRPGGSRAAADNRVGGILT